MGTGVASQVARTPGMRLVFMGALDEDSLRKSAEASGLRAVPVRNTEAPPDPKEGEVLITTGTLSLLKTLKVDVLVECTNSIYDAALYCLAAIDQKAHVVLMNGEVDFVFGTLLAHEARKQGVVVTSDAGDQHGVLATMAEEIQLWGFRIVQAGNMKGFLNRHATSETQTGIAAKLGLSVIQCVSYTDGTKMNIEQALIGNYLGLTPLVPGMEGPVCSDLREVLDKFDFSKYGDGGHVDYTLGVPWPGGGVYIVGYCDDTWQDFMLRYYKVTSRRPYYLFFRPYHLCHIETPRAIAQAYFEHRPVISPPLGRKINDVFAYAKQDLKEGQLIHRALGGDEVYGMIDARENAEARNALPVALLQGSGKQCARLKVAKRRDAPLLLSDIEIPRTPFHDLLNRQAELIKSIE